MKATLVNKYNRISKTTGKVVRTYVYEVVSATADELTEYEITQGVNYRVSEDSGNPLFFTSQFEGNQVELMKGKSKDRITGILTDVYRPLSSEEFELKRDIMQKSLGSTNPVASVVNKAKAETIDVSGAEF